MKFKFGPYSPSRLETATCGYQFFNTYIEPDKAARAEGLAQARGSAVHEVFEKITLTLKDTPEKVITDAMLREWITASVVRHPSSFEELQEVLDMAQRYIRTPYVMLTPNSGVELRLAIKFKRDAEGNAVTYKDIIWGKEVERYDFEECDYDDPEAAARGRADVLTISDDTTTAFILDHKTQPNIEDSDTFQLGFYAWVISKTYPFLTNIQTVLHFARYGNYADPFEWSKEELYRIENEFLIKASVAENRVEYEATPYKHCQYCPFINKCPALSELIVVDQESGEHKMKNNNSAILDDTNKAVKVAGIMNVVDEWSTKMNKNLRQFVTAYGPIAIPGIVFEHRGEEKIDFDKINKSETLRNQIYAVFEKYKVEPKHFMGFSETHSKSIWLLGNEELVKELSKVFPRKVKTMFKGYKQ